MKLKTLIADDEPLARERLRFLLSDDDEIEITGECRNGKEVVAALKNARADLLFLDIQMPGQSGFQIIEQVGIPNMPITVFVTAHNHYAVKAFEVHALDYLTKPVEPERLQAALARVRERMSAQAALMTHEQLKAALAGIQNGGASRRDYPKRLLIPNGTKDAFVNVDEIDWIEAADYYACVHLGTKSLMLRESIKQLVDTLDPAKFVRVHRSVIVNIDRVREILREGRSESWLVLAGGERLKMSKAGWQNLIAVSRS